MKKYENLKNNVIGSLVKKYREKRGLSKINLCRLLQFHAIYLDSTELKRIEDGQMIVKDFELIGFSKVLKIPYSEIEDLIE